MKLNHAIVAGTFDHLHQGHQKLLTTALQSAHHLSCGLTQKHFTRKKPLASLIQSLTLRRQELSQFLSPRSNRWSIFALNDPLEPAVSSLHLDSIVASTETAPTVNKINHLRRQKGLKSLHPVIINLIKSTDQHRLSSTRIRQGQVNRQGFAYHQVFPSKKTLHLPSIHRQSFRRPFATLLTGSQSHLGWAGLKARKIIQKNPPFLTIAVGDIAVISLLQQNINLDLAIVDLRTKRQPLFSSLDKLGLPPQAHHIAVNPPSTITPDLVNSLIQSFNSLNTSQTILVKGEEDLSVLPAILLSPLNTAIFYGQPGQGLVHIRVTEKSKQKALRLLQKFT
jgi:cytidyltransferase-like protein